MWMGGLYVAGCHRNFLGVVNWIGLEQITCPCERGDGRFVKIRGISLLAEELLGICSME